MEIAIQHRLKKEEKDEQSKGSQRSDCSNRFRCNARRACGTGQYTTPAVLESHFTERGCYGPQGKTDGSSNDALKRCLVNQLKENGGIGSISEQLLDTRADVTIGGGSKYFRQTVQGGEYAGKTVWEQAKEMGYQTVENDPAAIAMIVKTAKISR